MLENINPEDVRFSSKGLIKKDLNRNIWGDDDKMIPEVRNSLLKISKLFWEYLGISIKPIDVVVRGSIANYNWTNQSDIDLHLIFDFSKINEKTGLVKNFLDSKRFYWNLTHDIKVKGFDVEMYSEDLNDESSSLSTYSIYKNDWIDSPNKIDKINVDEYSVKTKASDLMNQINSLNKIKKDEYRYKAAKKIKDKIKKMRQSGLNKGGEFSVENLAFKVLRRSGYLNKLSDIYQKSLDTALSLQEVATSKAQQRLFGMVRAYQKGELDTNRLPKGLRKKISTMAKTISKKDVVDFASTKLKNLPEKIDEMEGSSSGYEYGCLMLYFDIPWWEELIGLINKDDLYQEEGYGLEKEPHVTLLYGFHDNEIDFNEIDSFVNELIENPVNIELTSISSFKNEKYDVLKFDVKNEKLNEINKFLRDNFKYTSEFEDYNPHMTIAYLLPNLSDKYKDLIDLPISIKAKKVVYSRASQSEVKDNLEWSFKKKNIVAFDKNLGLNQEKKNIVRDFVSFTCSKLKMSEPVTVILKNSRDEYISTTAAYAPDENENHIKAGGRALVDILRSIGHELVHNRQRELKMFKPGEAVQNIGGKIEDQANSVAGILIKDFSKNYNYDVIYEI